MVKVFVIHDPSLPLEGHRQRLEGEQCLFRVGGGVCMCVGLAVQCQGHSEDSNDQNMTLSTIFSEMLIS